MLQSISLDETVEPSLCPFMTLAPSDTTVVQSSARISPSSNSPGGRPLEAATEGARARDCAPVPTDPDRSGFWEIVLEEGALDTALTGWLKTELPPKVDGVIDTALSGAGSSGDCRDLDSEASIENLFNLEKTGLMGSKLMISVCGMLMSTSSSGMAVSMRVSLAWGWGICIGGGIVRLRLGLGGLGGVGVADWAAAAACSLIQAVVLVGIGKDGMSKWLRSALNWLPSALTAFDVMERRLSCLLGGSGKGTSGWSATVPFCLGGGALVLKTGDMAGRGSSRGDGIMCSS